MTNVELWRGTWRPNPRATSLGLTLAKPGQGDFGLADFSAGTYPACSLHGAMNKVSKDAEIWRCLACNIGCELSVGMGRLTPEERTELDALEAKVREPNQDGQYPHWTREERDRRRELVRKRDPGARCAPSTEEMARRFGHRSGREGI